MIKKFAKTLDYEIPKTLQPYIVAAIFGETTEVVNVRFPIFPNGFPVLIHVYGDLPLLEVGGRSEIAPSRLNLAGQIHDTFPKMQLKGYFGQNGFLLHPLTPYYLFHIKGNSFVNKWIPLEKNKLYNWAMLHKNLNDCNKPIDRVAILAGMLADFEKDRLPPITWLDLCIASIYQNKGSVSVNELVATADISVRHFSRVFKEIVGVPPKYFCKVVQLNWVFEAINNKDESRVLKLALDSGYYDQSHFIRDFKKLIGDSPERFLMGNDAYVKEYLGRQKS